MKKLLSAAADAGDVPIDVICSILSYLPVKSVLRFRCVSKSWYSLINDSHFKKSHLLHSHDQVFVLRSPDKYYSFYDGTFFDDIVSGESTMGSLFTPIPAPPICNGTKLLATCDGLLLDVKYDCLSSPGSSYYDLGYDSSADDYKIVGGRLNISGYVTPTRMP